MGPRSDGSGLTSGGPSVCLHSPARPNYLPSESLIARASAAAQQVESGGH